MVSAATKLRYIYNKKSRAERIEMAEAFGYGGTDASKLRVVRRLAAQKVPKERKVSLNRYFRSFSTLLNKNPYKGNAPLLSLDGLYHVVSSVMYVAQFGDRVTAWSSNLNPSGSIGETRTPAFSSNIEYLLRQYGETVEEAYNDEEMGESGFILGIAFSKDGAVSLRNFVRKNYPQLKGTNFQIPTPKGKQYGIALMPSRKGVKGGQEVPNVAAFTSLRRFPPKKRDVITKYVNRSYSAYRRNK